MPLNHEDFTNNLFAFLIETFESPPEPSSLYLDQQAGLFDTLHNLSAEQASTPVIEGTLSIAAQVEHTRFYLDVVRQFMEGRTEKVDWQESWQVEKVTPEAWAALQQDLRATYEQVSQTLQDLGGWGDDEISDGMAIVVHTAYHLGAIRQMVKVVT